MNGCLECWDGGLVGKGAQGANVVPMEAIWRYARTEWLEWLECLEGSSAGNILADPRLDQGSPAKRLTHQGPALYKTDAKVTFLDAQK